MSKKSRPTKTRIRKSSSYISNSKRTESDSTRSEQVETMLTGQRFVDSWNTEYVGAKDMKGQSISEHFDNIQLEDGLVIQMYFENPIKQIMRNSDTGEVLHIDYNIRQIDARQHNTDAPYWVPSPFPVIHKGVIMGVSPRTKLWYYEQKEKLAKYDPVAAEKMLIPEVGDVVYTKHFMFKDKRYYTDKQKQCEDLVKNQVEIRLNEFDFLFLIENYDIESIVKKDNLHLLSDNQVSIDERYLEVNPAMLAEEGVEIDTEIENTDEV